MQSPNTRMNTPETNLLPHPFTLRAKDSLELSARRWEPTSDCVGQIGIVHGLGEHSGRFAEFAQWLAGAGYRVVTFDHRGHGLTEGKRGHVGDYGWLLDDIDCLLAQMAADKPLLPTFLLGHSLGGNLVVNHVLRRRPELDGIVISSPLFRPTTAPPAWKRRAARLINRIAPSFTLNTGVRAINLSHDPECVQGREADPLVHNRVSVRLAIQMLEAGEWAFEHAQELTLPVLLMHGDEDKITCPAATRSFASRVTAPCELYVSVHGYHELHRETDRENAFSHVIAWLEARRLSGQA